MLILLTLFALLLAALAIWELVVCEGAHLGPRVVIPLYDLTAQRYDSIKQFDWDWERRFLGEPLQAITGELLDPLILDVGAGTGRTARALAHGVGFAGQVVCLEPSRRMLSLGRQAAPVPWASWLRGLACPLPFLADVFDAVVMLELLEFTPSAAESLRELQRVLRPGGWMLVSNRVGRHGRWITGRNRPSAAFAQFLSRLGWQDVETYPWQVEYDLVWARKPWLDEARPMET
ncbi:MAG: class I SAM-dependent methyltransferase [Anaerolineales bacterium]|nr:class I SAM-dependent methyltransferase [Anaerolineales bacterium]